MRIAAAGLLCAILTIGATAQNTIQVPADQPTIQAAINAASPGDTVIVAPGIYVENINFLGKTITVTSSSGAQSTIIDGGGVKSVVTFNSAEGSGSVLNGFTVRNGYGVLISGGGIEISGASPTITNNLITGNRASQGIGIRVNGGSPLIQGNTITGNVQGQSSATGGGISVAGNNTQFASPKILNNVITNHNVGASGGGIAVSYFSSPLIENNYIAGNYAYVGGGGIWITSYQSSIVRQNIIVNNSSGSQDPGSGIYVVGSTSGQPQVINNTLYGNFSSDGASSLYIDAGAGSILSNNIVVATSGNGITCANTYNKIPGMISSNLSYSMAGQSWAGSCLASAGVSGNLDADPLFTSPASGDFHLQPGSPAVDAGDITIPSLPTHDYSGAARLGDDSGECNFVIDLGAYQSHSAAPGSLSISPASATLIFPDTAVGTNSAPLPLLLTGAGQGCFRLTGFNLIGDFAQTNSCGAGVPAGQSCTVQVVFVPTAAGLRAGTLSVPMSTNAGAPPSPVTLSGNGLVPHGTPSPSPLNFPGQNVNTTSAPIAVTLTNDGGVSLTVNSVSVTGEFAQTNNCNTPIAPGTSCSIQITFTPTRNGQRSGTLSIVSNSSPAISNVTVRGLGLGPEGSFSSPQGLNFYQQVVNTTSPALSTTLTNVGALPMHIAGFSFDTTYGTDFAQTNNCPATLVPNASCIVQVTFTPITSGWRQGFLNVTSDAPAFYLITNGYGATNVAQWVASPGAVDFGDVTVTQTATQNILLTNNGQATLTISSIVASSPFNASGCVGSFDPGMSCMIAVSWTPQAAGVRNGTLTIYSNSVNYIQSLAVTGRAVQPVLSFWPTTLTFATQNVGTTSAPQSITLSNTGSGTYTLSQIVISGPDFTQTSNCPASIAPGTSCTINVVFNPTAAGALSAILAASGSPAGVGGSVQLSGTGVSPAPVASVSPKSLTFASQVVGTTSAARAVTLSNTGTATLSISSIQIANPFAQTNDCGSSLAPGATCTINITFTPTARGAVSINLWVNVALPAQNQMIILSGTGLAPVGSFSPTSVTFPLQRVGTTSSPQVVTFSNTGDTALTISSIAAAGAIVFAQTNNCPATLAPGSSCSINATFQPAQSGGAYYGDIVVTDDSGGVSGTQQQSLLTGTGGVSTATLSPSSLTFGSARVGTSTTPSAVTISNNGAMPLNVSSISTSGDFSQSNNCGTLVVPGASCVVNVIFAPSATGTRNGSLTINSDAQFYNSESMSLSGTGVLPIASVAPGSLTFGTIPVGTQSSVSAGTLSNTGSAPMSISSIASTGDFVQTNNCPTTLAAGSSCTISVIFAPSAGGTRTGWLTITDDASGGSQMVSLSGSATDFSVIVSPTSVSINAGQSANYNAKVSAVGGLYNQSVSLTCSGVPAGATCTFTPISVIPGSTSQTSKLKITTSNGGTPKGTYTIVVSGVVNNVVRTGTATLIVK